MEANGGGDAEMVGAEHAQPQLQLPLVDVERDLADGPISAARIFPLVPDDIGDRQWRAGAGERLGRIPEQSRQMGVGQPLQPRDVDLRRNGIGIPRGRWSPLGQNVAAEVKGTLTMCLPPVVTGSVAVEGNSWGSSLALTVSRPISGSGLPGAMHDPACRLRKRGIFP